MGYTVTHRGDTKDIPFQEYAQLLHWRGIDLTKLKRSARLLMGYIHAGAVAPPAPPPVESFGEFRELAPLW